MQSRFHPMFYVILPLAVLGFATQFDSILRSFAIPIALVAVLFVLYFIMQKRQPGGSRGKSNARFSGRPVPRQTRRQPEKAKQRIKTMPFRVIEGNKHRDDDEPPRYH